jgi:hypothetical protein
MRCFRRVAVALVFIAGACGKSDSNELCASVSDCTRGGPCKRAAACILLACGYSVPPAGTTIRSPLGDCAAFVCDGAGGATPVVDDTDLPYDGNPCTAKVCTSGTPSNPPLPAGTPCTQSGGTHCDGAGACIP